MELEVMAMASSSSEKCCDCGCLCSLNNNNNNNNNNSLTWLRSVKRKFEEIEGGRQDVPTVSNAKVEMENECVALRETLNSQQQTIQELYTELDEERNASSSAANEAMSMILRLQREKAEIQMEARQFKRFAEEKMAHDEQERCALEDVLYKREQTIQSLTCEVQAYKHRMLSYGLTEDEVEGEIQKSFHSRSNSMVENTDSQFEFPQYDYPPLKCNMNETPDPLDYEDVADVEKYAFGETPRTGFGETPRSVYSDTHRSAFGEVPRTAYGETPRMLEKTVVGQSPRRSRHIRRFSNDSSSSFSGFVKDMGQDYSKENPRPLSSFRKADYFSHTEDGSNLRKMECASDPGDDMSDRVYTTIDSIHHGTQYNTGSKAAIGICEDYVTTPRESFNLNDIGDTDIKKLCMRIQLLEADKESMKQALLSMRTDKAQMILLKEIAQHLYKDMTPERRMPVKKPSLVGSFSFISTLKVYVWNVSQQCGLIVASGQGTPFETVEMSYKGTNVKTVADKKRNVEEKQTENRCHRARKPAEPMLINVCLVDSVYKFLLELYSFLEDHMIPGLEVGLVCALIVFVYLFL